MSLLEKKAEYAANLLHAKHGVPQTTALDPMVLSIILLVLEALVALLKYCNVEPLGVRKRCENPSSLEKLFVRKELRLKALEAGYKDREVLKQAENAVFETGSNCTSEEISELYNGVS